MTHDENAFDETAIEEFYFGMEADTTGLVESGLLSFDGFYDDGRSE